MAHDADRVVVGFLIALALPGIALAQDPPDLGELDLEELMKVRVVSASRKEQSQNEVPAAIYVLRDEDIRRSGATSIPEALRSVPGLEVARSSASSWAVSARGFNSTSANKMLVLVDGRSVYSPLHSGVFWDVQDVLLDNIERIEVIRGPGGSLWGSNAINGIINIIRKPASETQGVYLSAGGGTEDRLSTAARWGFKASEDVDVRLNAKYTIHDDSALGSDPGKQAFDGWTQGRGSIRTDWRASPRDKVSFIGDWYMGQSRYQSAIPSLTSPFFTPVRDRTEVQGGSLVGSWTREISEQSNCCLQLYYDYTSRSSEIFDDTVHTGDLDFQYRMKPWEGHDLTWGLGYRIYRSEIDGGFFIEKSRHTDDLISAFVQDDIVLQANRLTLTVGTKVEQNDYSGLEVQPSVRLLWTPAERHHVWTSVSRAVRTPSIIDADFRANAFVTPGVPTVTAIFGNKDFRSEDQLAFEAGYRIRPVDPVFIDVATFYNRYDNLRSIELGPTFSETDPAPTHDVVPYVIDNEMRAQTYGVEVATNTELASWWMLRANYTYLRMNLDPTDDSNDTTSEAAEKQNPHHQAWVRSAMNLPWDLTLDVMGRYVSRLSAYAVDAYVECDVRLAWRDPVRRIEAAIVGQSLVQNSHAEFNGKATRGEIERGVYASVTWKF